MSVVFPSGEAPSNRSFVPSDDQLGPPAPASATGFGTCFAPVPSAFMIQIDVPASTRWPAYEPWSALVERKNTIRVWSGDHTG
jgi:hypothetical protein